jgi:phenylalanyl-tRNA synthetase beta chain
MLIELKALRQELPALQSADPKVLCELLASLGFPVDAVDASNGTTVLEVDVTANRGDVLSHRGLARDIAARLDADLAPLPVRTLVEGEPLLAVRLESEACPLYATAILELGKAQGTPADVQAFLGHMGSNAKNLPPVDASNEILHRVGHPTHAFDADTIQGALIVRWARRGEKVVTLDGVERTLTEQDLVIADEAGAIALAGVMGGDSTKVTPATKRVLLESAYFDARTVRATARRHNLYTDASTRYGRGADPAMAQVARDMLVQRLEAWAGARLIGAWTAGAVPPAAGTIELSKALLVRVAGEPLLMAEAAILLKRLGCQMGPEPGCLQVVPPSWRHDLSIGDDLAEEVLRLRGYDKIPSALPPLEGSPEPLSKDYLKRRRISSMLAHLGFCQTVTYGFVDPSGENAIGDDPKHRTLKNPLGEEYSLMRGTLLRDLREAAALNLDRGAREVRLFELAPVFIAQPEDPATPILERWTLALVWAGETGGEDPLTPVRKVAAQEGKSHMIGILKALGVPEASIRSFERWSLAGVVGGAKDQLGWQFEVPLDLIPDTAERVIPAFTAFSRFPSAERDLSLLVGLDQAYRPLAEAMTAAVQAAAAEAFQDLRCVDVFRHKSLPVGRQAWLLRLRFQHPARTLTNEEVDGWMTSVLDAARSLGAELRG